MLTPTCVGVRNGLERSSVAAFEPSLPLARPQAGDGNREDSFGQSKDAGAGVNEESGGEPRSEPLVPPFQVASICSGGGCGRLDFDRDDLAVSCLDK
jgi:hypothetical protein